MGIFHIFKICTSYRTQPGNGNTTVNFLHHHQTWLYHLPQQLSEPIHDQNKLTATVEPFLPAPDHKMMGMVVQRQISNWSTPTVIYTLINSICVPGIWENYICIGVDTSYVLDYLQDNLYTVMWYQGCQRMPIEDYQKLICKSKDSRK